jgi:hypothetical protein
MPERGFAPCDRGSGGKSDGEWEWGDTPTLVMPNDKSSRSAGVTEVFECG